MASQVNIYQEVWVRLKPQGMTAWYRYFEKSGMGGAAALPAVAKAMEKHKDKDGYCKFTLCQLINIFGGELSEVGGMSSRQVFENDAIFTEQPY